MKNRILIFSFFSLFILGLTGCELDNVNESVNSIENDQELFSSDKEQNLPPGSTDNSDEDEDYN